MSEFSFDYSQFPHALAPRRFELINPEKDNGVYGHGVVMLNGTCIVGRAMEASVTIFPTIAEVKQQYRISWIDPAFD